jgi:hypothetical protein
MKLEIRYNKFRFNLDLKIIEILYILSLYRIIAIFYYKNKKSFIYA